MHLRFQLLFSLLAATCLHAQASPQALLAAHRYPEALTQAEASLRAHPGDAQAALVKSLALAGLHEPTKSLASFDQTLRLTHDATPVLEAASEIAYDARDKRAGRYLSLLLARDPGNQVANAMAGVLAYENKDCPSANAHFAQAGAALRGNVPAQMQYGDCLLSTGDTTGGTALFEQLVAGHPGDPTLAYNCAVAYVQARRYADAAAILKTMQAAAQLQGGDTLNLLGSALNSSGQLEDAISTYRLAAEENPHDERNYIDLAAISVEHQSPEAALAVLNAGLVQNQNSGALLTLRGAVRAQLGQNDEATADFEAAERLQPSKLYGAVGLGLLLRDSSHLPQAEQLLRERLRAHPSDGTLNYLVADVLVRQGAAPGEPKFEEARTLLKKAVTLQPDLAVAHGELGKLDLKAGRDGEAIAQLEQGVHYDATDRTSLNQLIAAYRRAGRTDDAVRVAAQLAQAVEHDRSAETERNRIHLAPVAEAH